MKKQGETGAALLELALIFPVVLLLTMGGLGLANGLRHMQAATTFSRAAARIAQRTCLERADKNVCLGEVASVINEQIAGDDFPNTRARIAVYQLDVTGAGAGNLNYVTHTGSIGPEDYFCTLTTAKTGINPYIRMTTDDGTIELGRSEAQSGRPRNIVIIAEVYVPLKDIFINLLSYFRFTPQGFYDSTII